jgi:hypothetical protein
MNERTSASSSKRRIYHFSLGDSSEGAIGYCAEIVGTSEEDAVARLRSVMVRFWEGINMNALLAAESPTGCVDSSEYLRFYVNSDAIGVDDIDGIYGFDGSYDVDGMGEDDEDDEEDEDGIDDVGNSDVSEV